MKIRNESFHLKSPLVFTFKDTKMGFPTGVQQVALFEVLVFTNLTSVAFAQSSSCPGIHVKVMDIRNRTGIVDCALFDSPVGFPIEVLHSATNVTVIRVRKTKARCDFEDIPPGTYALAVIHDENMNGKPDTNFLGIQRKATVFQTGQRACSAHLRSLPPVSSMTGGPWI